MDDRLLRPEERAVLALRGLYRQHGYRPFKMSKFEEYELYARNKDFLQSDRVITFTDSGGRLLALKPDVTLSIVKKGEDGPGRKQKLCYDESVFRPAASTGSFREITQAGLECIGDLDGYDVYEAVCLAAQSLGLIAESYVLEVNHLGLLTSLLDGLHPTPSLRRQLARCLAGKNRHDLRRLGGENGLDGALLDRLEAVAAVYDAPEAALERLRGCGVDGAALEELEALAGLLNENGLAEHVVFDGALVCDLQYYNGVVFRGYLPGVAEEVLSGGQYDRLLARMGRSARAVGFALYLDRLEALDRTAEPFDVDVLLLYTEQDSTAAVARAVRALVDAGRSVSAEKRIPEKLRYRELRRLGKEAGRC